MATASTAIAVVRVRAEEPGWPLALPALRAGHVVTVSVTPATHVHVDDLAERGYRFAGLHPAPLAAPGVAIADLVIGDDLVADAPDAWRTLLDVGERVFPLANGPVAKVFAGLVAAHQMARRPATTP